MPALLEVRELTAELSTPEGTVHAVDRVDLTLEAGRTVALLGESGCGKSMTALAMMRLMPQPAGRIVGGEVRIGGDDVLNLSEAEMRRVRGRRMAMIFQEPMTSLNPVLTIGSQIGEALRINAGMGLRQARGRSLELLREVGIPDPARRVHEYPHQLSGGLKQRVMIAIALAGEPDILIADEPTTALDVTIQAQILDLLAAIQHKRGMGLLLITHDLGVVARVADRVALMYAGEIVEEAPRDALFRTPRHPYTRQLFESLPDMRKRSRDLAVIPGRVPALTQRFDHCRFANRCAYAWSRCFEEVPAWHAQPDGAGVRCHLYAGPESAAGRARRTAVAPERGTGGFTAAKRTGAPLLEARDLQVHFPIRKGLFKRTVGYVYAVDGVSLSIAGGRTLALVGESGCGKTTAGKAILRLTKPTGGQVTLDGEDIAGLPPRRLKAKRRDMQMVFQDPFSSMNPRMLVGDIVEEGLIAQNLGDGEDARRERVAELLEQVGLEQAAVDRYPHEFSGGQRQRISIARALAVEPRLLVCDEPTSALDVSVQAQILNLMQRLQGQMGLSYLFITHNMSVVAYLAHDVAVMYLGRIVERGTVEEVLQKPRHPYTQTLLSAVPDVDSPQREVIRPPGDPPSPASPPTGCHFHPRCPHAMPICRQRYPGEERLSPTHSAHCFLLGEGTT